VRNQQTFEEFQSRVRTGDLPQLIDVGARALEIIGFECRLGLRNEICDFLWILRSVSDSRRRRLRSVALRSKNFDAQEYYGECNGETAADHHRKAFGIGFVRSRLVVGASSSGHCRRFCERIPASARRRLRWFQRRDSL
jgi:hypothetical protein